MSRNYLITGGAGFIGSNFVRHVLHSDNGARVTNLDLLTYAGVAASLADFEDEPRYRFVRGDIGDAPLVNQIIGGHDTIVNFAAESHVDRSITGPAPFLQTNVVGTSVLLEAAYRHEVPTFVQVSTDEVYGSLEAGVAAENSTLAPSSPYAASKAAADLLAGSYRTTYGYPVIITRCTNNYGPYQFPEKVIPLFVTNLHDDLAVPLYGDGLHERDWLHVEDHCRALTVAIERGTPGDTYNIGSDARITNLDLTRRILDIMDRDEASIDHVPDRPGHDRRYAVDSSKI